MCMWGGRRRLLQFIWHGHHCYHSIQEREHRNDFGSPFPVDDTKRSYLMLMNCPLAGCCPDPTLSQEKGLVITDHFLGCAESAVLIFDYVALVFMHETVMIFTLILDKKLKVLSGFFLLVFPVYRSFCVISNPSSVLFISCGRKDLCEAWEKDNVIINFT